MSRKNRNGCVNRNKRIAAINELHEKQSNDAFARRELQMLPTMVARHNNEQKSIGEYVICATHTMAIPLRDKFGMLLLDENGKQRTKNVQCGERIVKRVPIDPKTGELKQLGSNKFEKSSIDISDDGDLIIEGKFVPSTLISPAHYGHARFELDMDESGKFVRPCKQQTYEKRTKYTHLNAHTKCRGQIAVSGGHVKNEMTTPIHDAIEMEIGEL